MDKIKLLSRLSECIDLDNFEQFMILYNEIINSAKDENRVKLKDWSLELHHIVPKCIGGNDDSDNLVLLTSLEHIVAHSLLFLMYPDNYKLTMAVWGMLNLNKEGVDQRKDAILDVISAASSLRELVYRSRCKAVVAIREDNTVAAIFPSTSSVVSVGIRGKNISSAINGKRKFVAGFRWKYLKDFEKEFPDKVELFLNSENSMEEFKESVNQLSQIYERGRTGKIVCFRADETVVKIYDNITLAAIDANLQNGALISRAIKRKCVSKGYFWDYLDSFIVGREQKIEEYYSTFSKETNYIKPIGGRGNCYVCRDFTGEFVGVFSSEEIESCANINKKRFAWLTYKYGDGVFYRGYFWTKTENYRGRIEEINEFFKVGNISINDLEFSSNLFSTKDMRLIDEDNISKAQIRGIMESFISGSNREYGYISEKELRSK